MVATAQYRRNELLLLSHVPRLKSTLTRREATRTQLLTAAIHGILVPNP